MIRLEDISLFIRSAALGSFSSAAREADLLPGQVSAAIQRLERELDKRLFARSTRSLRLTAEGERYLPYALEMLEVVQAGAESLHSGDEAFSGELKISVPSDTGRNVLLAAITTFCERHPKLTLRLALSDRISDVFRDPVDVAIRYGVLDDSSYVALPLAQDNRRVLAASPDYLARYGRPSCLEALASHHCILFTINGHAWDRWPFDTEEGPRELKIHGRLISDDADVARRWAVAGMGIVYKSWIDLYPDIAAGRLEVLLPQIPGQAAPLNFICPHRRQFSPVIRGLYRQLQQALSEITGRR
jgi:DNA-binding transcriptional LysR family regulator